MSATSTLIQQPAPELRGGCSLITGGEASAASVQVGRGASTSLWPAAAHGSSYGRDHFTLLSGRSRICSSPSASADELELPFRQVSQESSSPLSVRCRAQETVRSWPQRMTWCDFMLRSPEVTTLQPQPTASKPAPLQEVASRALARLPDKNGEQRGREGPETRGWDEWRSRGKSAKHRQDWHCGRIRKSPERVRALESGGAIAPWITIRYRC